MKYLFLINSHTTFLSAVGTIEFLGLKDEEIRFGLIRNYKNALYDFKSPTVDFSWAFEYPFFSKIFQYRKFINRIDSILLELTDGDDFTMCASFPGNIRLYQIIFTNKRCVGFKYIQEGALPFEKVYQKSVPFHYSVYSYLLRFFFHNRLWSSHGVWTIPDFLSKKLKTQTECYAIDEFFFENLDCKLNIIKWPSIDLDKTEYAIRQEYPCFVFESSVEMGVVEKEVYMDCTKALISQKGACMNYIKFHPYQQEENKRIIIKLFDDLAYKTEILPMEVPFEFYLSSYKSMKVYGFKSSLLIFAQNLGHETYSLEDELLKRSKIYREFRYSR